MESQLVYIKLSYVPHMIYLLLSVITLFFVLLFFYSNLYLTIEFVFCFVFVFVKEKGCIGRNIPKLVASQCHQLLSLLLLSR